MARAGRQTRRESVQEPGLAWGRPVHTAPRTYRTVQDPGSKTPGVLRGEPGVLRGEPRSFISRKRRNRRIHTTTIFCPDVFACRLLHTYARSCCPQDNTETCTRLAQAGACGCWQCRVLPSRACTAAQTVSCREAGDGCCARLVLS
jgi:hypothetical protein